MISKRVMALILTAVLTSSCVQNPVKAEALSVDNLYANAYKATVTAVEGKNQKLINEARSAIKMLPQNLNWAIGEFSKQIDKVQHPIFAKAYNAVVLAGKNPTQANIDAAKDAIDPDMPIYFRGSYSSKIDKIQNEKMKQALEAYNKALTSKLQVDIDFANKLFDDIRSSKNPAISQWVELVQAKGDLKDLNNGGVHTNNYAILSNAGVYGPTNESKPTTIKGNILVSNTDGKSLTLQNINIEGTLIVNFGSGDVVLNNVKVNGVNVNNIGSKSLHVKGNSAIKNLTVKDTNNDARIVIEEKASVESASVLSGAKLEVSDNSTSSKPFGDVVIAPTDTNKVILEGTFTNVSVDKSANVDVTEGSKVNALTLNSNAVITGTGNIANLKVETSSAIDLQAKSVGTLEVGKKAEGAKVNISEHTKIDTLNVNASVDVTGKGTIKNANIGASGTTIEVKPENVSVTEGVKAEVGGVIRDDSNSNIIDKVPGGSNPPVVVDPPSSGGGSTGGIGGGETQPSYNTPGGEYTGPNVIFNVTSTNSANPSLMGPSTGVAKVKSDIVINAGEENIAKLRNLEVYGNIIINGKNGNGGSITLDNVKVCKTSDDPYGFNSGRVIVNDVAENSLHLENGVNISKLLIEDNNGSRIDVSNATIGEVEISSDNKSTRNVKNAKLELSDKAVIKELLVKTENIEIKDSVNAIKFIQGDGVELENIKTNSDSTLKELVKTVNTEDKIKEKLSEINNLYKASNGITEMKLYNYVNNKLRVLVENIADMEMTYGDDKKVFTLPNIYKTFNLSQKNGVAGNINAMIRDGYNGEIKNLSELQKILNEEIPFAIREIEIAKYLGYSNNIHTINIFENTVGEKLEEMFKVKDGEVVEDYYDFELTSVNSDFAQLYEGEIYMMKNFVLAREVNSGFFGYTNIKVTCNDKIPEELKTGETRTNLMFKYENIIGLNKDIKFVDIAKTPSGTKIVLRVAKNNYNVEMKAEDFKFNINGVKLETSSAESGMPADNGDYFYVYNVESSNLVENEEIILTTTFNENGKDYEYKKRFKLEDRDLEGTYKFQLTQDSQNAIQGNKIKIKALDKADNYNENNKRYLLNLELDPYYINTTLPNLDMYDSWAFKAISYKTKGEGQVSETPIVEFESASIIKNNGKTVVQIPLVLKREPKEDEEWTISVWENSDKIIVDPMYLAIDFSNVFEKTEIIASKVPEKIQVETEIKEDENGKVAGFNTEGRTPASISLIKGTENYSNVRLVVESADENDDLSGIQLIAKDSVGNWYNIVKTGWGSEGGFELKNATTDVYIVANKPGTYKAIVKLVDVSNDNKVIAQSKVLQVTTDRAPEFLEEPIIKDVTSNSAKLHVKANENSKGYYMLVESKQPEPTYEQVIDAKGYTGIISSLGGFRCDPYNNGTDFRSLKGSTSYTVYFLLEDELGNRQTELTKISFATDKDNIKPSFIEGYPSLNSITSNSATITLKSSEASIAHYVVLEKGAIKPTVEEILNKIDSSGNPMQGASFGTIDQYREKNLILGNLKSSHSYVVYLVLNDLSGNVQSEAIEIEVNTLEDKVDAE